MRHRAPRPLVPHWLLPGLRRHGVVVGAGAVLLATLVGVGLVTTQDTQATASRSDAPFASGTTDGGTDAGTPGAQSQEPTSALTGSTRSSGAPSASRSATRGPVLDGPTTLAELETRLATPEPSLSAGASATPTGSSPIQSSPAPTSQAPSTQAPSSPSPSSQAPSPSDQSAPNTSASTITANAVAWTISLGSNESSSYECSLDGGSYTSCGSTVVYSNLDRGWHTFAARATDGAGNTDPSPAELSAKITGPGSAKN